MGKITPLKFDTTTIRLVMATVEEGSISRAADRVDLAVAAASRRISELEAQLGIKIFRRLPHGVDLTESGAKVIGHIQQVGTLVDRLAGDAGVLVRGLEGRLIIGATKAAIIQFLAADIARIQRRYPGISVKIVEQNSRDIQQSLRDRVIDVGIYESRSGFMELPQIPYRHDCLVLIYHRGHFEFEQAEVPLEALFSVPVVSLGKGSAILAALERAFVRRGRMLSNDFLVGSFDTMFALVSGGLGVGLMPPEVLRTFARDEAIGVAELAGDWHQRSYVLSVVEGHAQAQTLTTIVEALRGG